ncbi:MAG: putative acyltransferase [Gemmataceae bacterium]|nr:putative acyltransferase [Gemmataceae bacterium]
MGTTKLGTTRDSGHPCPAPFGTRYQSLDAWRGVACLMIVVLHASFYARYDPGSADALDRAGTALLQVVSRFGVGVDIFFVISGYCIAATADATRRKGRPSGEYFYRRFRRIYPPYWGALVLTILLTWALAAVGQPDILKESGAIDTGSIPHASDLSASQWVGNLTLTEHWRYHLFGSSELKLLGPSWTLCYEEQFYLVCGAILLLSPARFYAGVVGVTAFTVAGAAFNLLWGGAPLRGFFFDGRWLLFAAGVFVYWHLTAASRRARWAIPALLALSLIATTGVRYAILTRVGDAQQKNQMFEFAVGFGFALLLIGLRPWDEQLARLKVARPFTFCGRMCYSLYLIHWPVTKFVSAALFMSGCRGVWPTLLVTVPLALTLSLLAAWWFHVWVERRFCNPPREPGQPRETARGEPAHPVAPAGSRPAPYFGAAAWK